MHRKHGLRIFAIWEKSMSWVLASEEDGWLLVLAEALRRVPHVVVVVGGRDGKVVIERLYLSLPYVEKPFNSKVIKSFVPELRSRQVFFVFRDSYVIYKWVMNIRCTFHIFMYGYVTVILPVFLISGDISSWSVTFLLLIFFSTAVAYWPLVEPSIRDSLHRTHHWK